MVTSASLVKICCGCKGRRTHFLALVWIVASQQVTRWSPLSARTRQLTPNSRCNHSSVTKDEDQEDLAKQHHGRMRSSWHTSRGSCRLNPCQDESGSNPNPLPTGSGVDWSCRRCCSDWPPIGNVYANHGGAAVSMWPKGVRWFSHLCHILWVVHLIQRCCHRSSPPR